MKRYFCIAPLILVVFALVFWQPISKVDAAHSADTSGDFAISVGEVLRMVQLYNLNEYSCDADSEDGFAPGTGDQSCAPHDADYAPQDWRIDLSELLRVLQMYNLGTYSDCGGTEDGFCPGTLVVSEDIQFIPASELGSLDGKSALFGLFDTGTGSTRIYFQDGSSKLFVFDEG